MIPPSPPLLVITDRRMARGALADVVAAAFDGGCRWVMVREKDLPTAALTDLAAGIVAIGRGYGATVLVNGDTHAARQSGAHGVHLPQGHEIAAVRRVFGDGGAVGVSAHSMEEATAAAHDGADYVTLSPVFATRASPAMGRASAWAVSKTWRRPSASRCWRSAGSTPPMPARAWRPAPLASR